MITEFVVKATPVASGADGKMFKSRIQIVSSSLVPLIKKWASVYFFGFSVLSSRLTLLPRTASRAFAMTNWWATEHVFQNFRSLVRIFSGGSCSFLPTVICLRERWAPWDTALGDRDPTDSPNRYLVEASRARHAKSRYRSTSNPSLGMRSINLSGCFL